MKGSLKTGFGAFRLPFAFGAIRPDTFAKPAADGTPAVRRYCSTHKTLSNPRWATSPCRSVLDFRLPCCGRAWVAKLFTAPQSRLSDVQRASRPAFPATARRRFQAAVRPPRRRRIIAPPQPGRKQHHDFTRPFATPPRRAPLCRHADRPRHRARMLAACPACAQQL